MRVQTHALKSRSLSALLVVGVVGTMAGAFMTTMHIFFGWYPVTDASAGPPPIPPPPAPVPHEDLKRILEQDRIVGAQLRAEREAREADIHQPAPFGE